MTTAKKYILLCEDDINLSTMLTEYLSDKGYTVHTTRDGEEGQNMLLAGSYDLCLTEISLDTMNGLQMVKEVRDNEKTLPIIIVSDKADKEDIIAGYKAGCDDYVIKPFSMEVLLCKIEAWLRRAGIEEENKETIFQLGDVTFDAGRQYLGDKRLSGRENDLLLMLCRRPNQVVERSRILKQLWNQDNYFASRSLAVYVNHLRHYLTPETQARIVAVHGKGYKIILN